jgi:dTDP-glucose 4,6-dehydratase
MNKIFIIGISSFSGASIASYLLKKGLQVYGSYSKRKYINELIYDKKKVKEFKIDLTKDTKKLVKLLKKIKPSVVLDHASICMVNESWKFPKKYFDINVKSRIDIMEDLKNMKFLKKYIYISTPEIFGSTKKNLKESYNVYKPSTPYAASKLSAELNFKIANSVGNLPLIISRFTNFYGPGQPLHRLIPKVLFSIKKGLFFPLHGGGLSKRNFIFSEDFCYGIWKMIIKGKPGNIYHFSGEKYASVKEIIKIICDLKKKKFKKIVKVTNDRLGKDDIYSMNSSKTKKILNWKPKTSLRKGIEKTIKFYEINYKSLKKQSMNFKI